MVRSGMRLAVLALVLGGAGAVPAATLDLPTSAMVADAARRFPQPVRVGDLANRRLLEPKPSQSVLGRIAGTVRRSDGGAALLVDLPGWLGAGFGSRRVAVPVEAVALLGEHVALLGLSPSELAALPAVTPDASPPFPADETIRVGLAKPFH